MTIRKQNRFLLSNHSKVTPAKTSKKKNIKNVLLLRELGEIEKIAPQKCAKMCKKWPKSLSLCRNRKTRKICCGLIGEKTPHFPIYLHLNAQKKKHHFLHFSKKQRFSYYSRSKILIGKNDLNFRPFFSIFQKNTISYLITCFKNPQKTLFFGRKIIEIDLFFSI